MFRSLGLADESGNIYEMLEYAFFEHSDMGYWEKMMQGMVNVSTYKNQLLYSYAEHIYLHSQE